LAKSKELSGVFTGLKKPLSSSIRPQRQANKSPFEKGLFRPDENLGDKGRTFFSRIA